MYFVCVDDIEDGPSIGDMFDILSLKNAVNLFEHIKTVAFTSFDDAAYYAEIVRK